LTVCGGYNILLYHVRYVVSLVQQQLCLELGSEFYQFVKIRLVLSVSCIKLKMLNDCFQVFGALYCHILMYRSNPR